MERPVVISYLRFSRPEQLKGDSIRRQLELGERWAKTHNMIIADSYRDLGISAFRGANATEGNLSRFLKLVDEGRIPSKSVLLIEQLDRLSRNALLEALELFLSIIRRGIKIVTLMDGQEYDTASLNKNMQGLMYSIMQMSLAHEESAKKSERLGHAWKAKRDRLMQKVYTRQIPAWMKVDGDRIVIDEPKAAIVREMVNLALAGHGLSTILKRMNAKYDGLARVKYFNRSYIFKILHNRALIGEFHPHKLTYVDGKRTRQPIGEPITGYYPALIDSDTFYTIQKKFSSRKNHGGPVSKFVNIFNGTLYDAKDQSAMVLQDKGLSKRYVSGAATLGRRDASPYIAFPVEIFERGFILNFHDYILPRIFQADDGTAEREVDASEARLAEVEKKIAKLNEQMLDADAEQFDASLFATALNKLGKQRQALKDQHEAALQRQAAEHTERRNNLDERLIKLVKIVKQGGSQLNQDQRIQLREAIRSTVARIDATFTRIKRDYYCDARVTLRDGAVFDLAIFALFVNQMKRNAKGHPIKSDRPTCPKFKLGLGEPRWMAVTSADGQTVRVAQTEKPMKSMDIPISTKAPW